MTSVYPPKQERSKETLSRILAAIETLLCTKDFEEVTIDEIVEFAGTSVGAFYKRFSSKEAVLPFLVERHLAEQLETAQRIFVHTEWTGVGLADRTRQLFAHALRVSRERRGLLRVIFLRQQGNSDALTATERSHAETTFELVADWLLECREEITHPKPDRAVRFALLFAFSVIHQKMFFPDSPRVAATDLSEDLFLRETVRSFLGYLTFPEEGPK